MPRRSARSRTPSTTSTSTPRRRAASTPPGQGAIGPAGRNLDPSAGPRRGDVNDSAARLAARLGLPVRDLDLLRQALVHSSYVHEHPDDAAAPNERLEFFGDAVVNLAVSEALYRRHPLDDEGMLSARRAAIVSTAGLARLGSRVDLGADLLLGGGESMRGSRSRPSLLASGFEALVGALYLDLGYDAVRAWLLELAAPEIGQDLPLGSLKSPKSQLQEYTQRLTGGRPIYHLVEATGPDHDRTFQIDVEVEGQVHGTGIGPSRRIAETAAATMALESLKRTTE